MAALELPLASYAIDTAASLLPGSRHQSRPPAILPALRREGALFALEKIAATQTAAWIRLSVRGQVEFFNPPARTLAEQLIDPASDVSDLLPPNIRPHIEALVTGDSPFVHLEYTVEARMLSCELHYVSEFVVIYAVITDVTRQRQLQEQLTLQATRDSLTGLRNRSCFYDDLKDAILDAERQGGRLAFMCLDVDRFKYVNDSLGHAVGDCLLRRIATRLRRIAETRGNLWRIGGDEFGLLLQPAPSDADVAAFAREVLSALSAPMQIGPHELVITASLGIAMFPQDGDDPDLLLQNADAAMYLAKKLGKNQHSFFSRHLSDEAQESMCVEQRIRRALRNGEFDLHYQPQIDLHTGRVVGREALLRWRSPQPSDPPLAHLIAVAEETGLIVPIGDWVLATACRQNKSWQDAGFAPARVAVNISTRQLALTDFCATVRAVLDASGLEPRYLELEITETAAMTNVDATISALCELKLMGVVVAIDDFGIGHSSLGYLNELPVDRLKIDQSFLREVACLDNAAQARVSPIVKSMIELAHSMGILAVAEGVETADMIEYLIASGCDEAQGYLFGAPVAAGEVNHAAECLGWRR